MQLSTASARPGDEVTVTVLGAVGDRVELGIESQYRSLATAPVIDSVAAATVTIPRDLEPGLHHLVALDSDGQELAREEITVLAANSAGELSDTGVEISVPLSAAAALLALGAGLAWRARRSVTLTKQR